MGWGTSFFVGASVVVGVALHRLEGQREALGRAGEYGLDAPFALQEHCANAAGLALAAAVAAAVANKLAGRGGRRLAAALAGLLALGAAVGCVACSQAALDHVRASYVGKHRVQALVLDAVGCCRGGERVLDVGCGTGSLLVAAALRLNGTGSAVGVDPWSERDQSSNAEERALANAQAEGVVVDVRTGDARDLRFSDGEFDAVVSSLALHNIREFEWSEAAAAERRRALEEVVRVLRPGGRLAIWDVLAGEEHHTHLSRMAQLEGVRIEPVAEYATVRSHIVTARKKQPA